MLQKREGGMTHEEIARVLGCTKARVGQIEKKALAKLAVAAKSRRLRLRRPNG